MHGALRDNAPRRVGSGRAALVSDAETSGPHKRERHSSGAYTRELHLLPLPVTQGRLEHECQCLARQRSSKAREGGPVVSELIVIAFESEADAASTLGRLRQVEKAGQ